MTCLPNVDTARSLAVQLQLVQAWNNPLEPFCQALGRLDTAERSGGRRVGGGGGGGGGRGGVGPAPPSVDKLWPDASSHMALVAVKSAALTGVHRRVLARLPPHPTASEPSHVKKRRAPAHYC